MQQAAYSPPAVIRLHVTIKQGFGGRPPRVRFIHATIPR